MQNILHDSGPVFLIHVTLFPDMGLSSLWLFSFHFPLLPTCHVCHFVIILRASYSVFLSVKTAPLINVRKIHSSSCRLLQGFGVSFLRHPPIVPQLFCPLVLLVPLWNGCFPPVSCGADTNHCGRVWLCCCARVAAGFQHRALKM